MNRKGESTRESATETRATGSLTATGLPSAATGRIVERAIGTGQETFLSPAGWKTCSWPACAPDGSKILFVTHDGGKDAICVAALGESEPRRVAEGEILSAPRWAPEGARIVYQSGAHLWMMDADGSNQRQLTTAGGVQSRPVWSPDGTSIAYCQGPSPKGRGNGR